MLPSKPKTTRDLLQRWRSFASRDSLQDQHDLEQVQLVPSPDHPMQGAADALAKALAATRARKAKGGSRAEGLSRQE